MGPRLMSRGKAGATEDYYYARHRLEIGDPRPHFLSQRSYCFNLLPRHHGQVIDPLRRGLSPKGGVRRSDVRACRLRFPHVSFAARDPNDSTRRQTRSSATRSCDDLIAGWRIAYNHRQAAIAAAARATKPSSLTSSATRAAESAFPDPTDSLTRARRRKGKRIGQIEQRSAQPNPADTPTDYGRAQERDAPFCPHCASRWGNFSIPPSIDET